MRRVILSLLAVVLSMSLLCSCTNRQMGTVGGAALGGVAGYGLTGSGWGAAAGAVGGGLIGNAVTR